MIHLFRKIRQKFIKEKRLSNYLAYAVGEVLLVVIGILLALQFSNWNQKKSEIKKEIWYLDNIANDMFYQKDGLVELKTNFEETLTIANKLLLDYKINNGFVGIDSLSFKLNKLMITYSYPNIDNTYRELLSSGKVNLIENDDILADIIDFYLNSNEIVTQFKTNEKQVFYGEVYPSLNKYATIDISDYTKNKELIFKDDHIEKYIIDELETPKVKLELTNAIKNKIIIISDYLITVDDSIKEVDRMIKEIDLEIQRLE